MVKTYVLASYSFLIFIFGWFMSPIEISMQAPTEIVAGIPFDVEITINKGSLDGFARFQQKLPEGFTAEVIDSETGDFRFEDQTIKIFWLIIPVKETITLRYTITTDQNISGNYSLDGIFSYIDGEKKYIEMPLKEITITPSPLANTTQDTSKIGMETAPQIVCKRKSVKINENGEIEIEILVNRGELDMEQFAKIQEIVPKGYDAKSIETKGGIFTYQNNMAKFLWMTLPAETEYIVSYKLIPQENTDLAKIEIKGNFSYLVNGQTVEVEMEEMDKSVNLIVEEQLAYRQGDLVADTTQIAENINETEATISNSDNNTIEQAIIAENNTSNEDNKLEANTNTENIVKIETPNTDVSYRVQIAAGHKRIEPVQYFHKLKVDENVNVEMLNGWYKYTIGEYNKYLGARDKRNTVWGNTPIDDAFVTAYNSGKRITVQEALMISNQTWLQ